MNINKMNNEQLKFLLEMNNNALEAIEIGAQNWRNAMIHELDQEEFEEKWKEIQAQNQLRINDIEKENLEIYKQLQA